MQSVSISISAKDLRKITAFCKGRGINRSQFLREKGLEAINRIETIPTNLETKKAVFPQWPKDKLDFSECPLALWLKTNNE